ncbi:MAG: hypothetical protein LBD29_02805 [Treponema sp.]|jgi:hypothetical protein|nr:hypothetical protein [Treponema sp.]
MTDFLANPVNTGITGGVTLAVLGLLMWFLSKRTIRISKSGVEIDNAALIDGRYLDKVPAIDQERKTRMRMELYNRKDMWLGLMHEIPDKTIRLFLLLKLLDALTTKIFSNHLTAIFSDRARYAEWKAELIVMIKAKLRYVEDYTGTRMHEKADKHEDEFWNMITSELEECVASMRDIMKFVITESCEAKIKFYKEILQSKPSDEQMVKTKELIERNESYIRHIAEF